MRLRLDAQGGGMKLKIPNYDAGSYQVVKDGNVIPETPWD